MNSQSELFRDVYRTRKHNGPRSGCYIVLFILAMLVGTVLALECLL